MTQAGIGNRKISGEVSWEMASGKLLFLTFPKELSLREFR
jgi:hypothetical protein